MLDRLVLDIIGERADELGVDLAASAERTRLVTQGSKNSAVIGGRSTSWTGTSSQCMTPGWGVRVVNG